SGSPQAATWVSDHVSEPYELLCDSAYKCSAVSARLDKSAYASATSEPFTFVVWRVGREADVQPGNAAAEARALSARTGHRVLVLLDEAPPLGAGLQVLFRTPRAMSDEQYWICALE